MRDPVAQPGEKVHRRDAADGGAHTNTFDDR